MFKLKTKRTVWFLSFLILLYGVLLVAGRFSMSPTKKEISGIPTATHSSVKIRDTLIPVEIASTDAERQRGLSGRASLLPDEGMLFVFLKPDIYHFWMLDMHFPIDIIWINEGVVVGIDKNVTNSFDPENPAIYSPSTPAQYVLEVNAGFADKNLIKSGDGVILKIKL